MIVILKQDVKKEKVEELCSWLQGFGVAASPIYGSEKTIIGLVGDTSGIDMQTIQMNECVDHVVKVQEPFKKANRKFHPDNTIVTVGGQDIGSGKICIIAGPCSVESEEQITEIARSIKDSGAGMLRGGAFKPRTSPYAFQGLKADGLMLLDNAKKATGMPIVSEITNIFHLELFLEYVDIIQVGARNMQNFELLKELGKVNRPILLKRGFSNTIEELLMSAEYIINGGNPDVILCERGIRTFENSMRNTLDLSAVPMLKKLSHLPVVVDPSHASGLAWMVEPLAKAAVAAGADGLIIEVHNNPSMALSDGQQSITPDAFHELVGKLRRVAEAVGRSI